MLFVKMKHTNEFITRTLTTLVLFALLGLVTLYLPPIAFSLLLILTALLVAREWLALCTKANIRFLWLLTPLYPFLPLAILAWLNNDTTYHPLIFPLLAITALHDIASYIVGKSCGKHLLLPAISPKKTYEGAVGGLGAVSVLVLLSASYSHANYSLLAIAGISIAWSLCALVGDLFESFLKRKAEIKDSGNLLPGHGGILDRLDSILFVSLFAYALRATLLPLFIVS